MSDLKLKSITIPETHRWVLHLGDISEVPSALVCRLSNYHTHRLDIEVINTVETPIDLLLPTFKQGDVRLDFYDKTGIIIQSWLYTNVKLKTENLTLGFLDYHCTQDEDTRHTFSLSFEYDELKRIRKEKENE